MAKMNWARCRFVGRPTVDHRYENELPDRAQRWLRKAKTRRERRTTAASSSSGVPTKYRKQGF
jgi:hypothetical protein